MRISPTCSSNEYDVLMYMAGTPKCFRSRSLISDCSAKMARLHHFALPMLRATWVLSPILKIALLTATMMFSFFFLIVKYTNLNFSSQIIGGSVVLVVIRIMALPTWSQQFAGKWSSLHWIILAGSMNSILHMPSSSRSSPGRCTESAAHNKWQWHRHYLIKKNVADSMYYWSTPVYAVVRPNGMMTAYECICNLLCCWCSTDSGIIINQSIERPA